MSQADAAGWYPTLLSGLAWAGANDPPTNPATGTVEYGAALMTAEEVGGLDLSACELAVLSACETGLGKVAGGEGVLGLQRAFHQAGARHVVASLWTVDDQVTRALMARFYEHLWQGNLGAAEALRKAQLDVLEGRIAATQSGARGIGPRRPGLTDSPQSPAPSGRTPGSGPPGSSAACQRERRPGSDGRSLRARRPRSGLAPRRRRPSLRRQVQSSSPREHRRRRTLQSASDRLPNNPSPVRADRTAARSGARATSVRRSSSSDRVSRVPPERSLIIRTRTRAGTIGVSPLPISSHSHAASC